MPEKMSTSSQNNGKKSSNSSIVNTPSSTPLTSIANGNTQVNTQSSPPPNNAPKYGTLVPNRIFVGGISANTTESELMQLFSSYGTVKAAKIIQDRAGVSKGYGFITFESEDDAKRPLREAENIVLRERKLNIAPAIKKQPFSRVFDGSSPPAVAAGNPAQFFFPPGAAMPYFQGGVAYYPQPAPAAPGDPNSQQPVYQPPPVYPTQTGPPQTATYPSMMFPTQTIYMPQQYPMPMPYDYNYYQNNGAPPTAQYMVGNQGGPGGPQCPPLPPSGSPPRPPCYSQQMPSYNPADPMFYNLPVYSTTMEGPPVYTEAYDLGTNGPYSEDAYGNMADHIITPQDLEPPVPPSPINAVNEFDHHTPSPQTLPTGDSNNDKTAPRRQTDNNGTVNSEVRSEDVATGRNSNTPVVSLLSIDHQQEKDYLSMQGGRRRKSNTQSAQNNMHVPHMYPSNGYINNLNAFAMGYHPQPYGQYNNSNYNQNGPVYHDYRRTNGMDNRGNKTKRRTYDRRSNDHSSRSSLRTDSNSSASCVDENKNEDKTLTRTNVNTPPPAPYSPMTPQFKIISNTNTRNYQNTARYNSNYRPSYNNNNNNNDKSRTYDLTKYGPHSSSGATAVTSTLTNPFTSQPSISQVHVATSQSFAPQARRSRRSIRRSGSAGVNEIGAGDAPLPNEDVCKKFETLKL